MEIKIIITRQDRTGQGRTKQSKTLPKEMKKNENFHFSSYNFANILADL